MRNNIGSWDDAARNKIRSILIYAARTVALMCASGTLLQTFLGVLGFDSSRIHLHSSVLQAANVLTIMLCSRWAERGSVIRRAAWISLPTAVLFLLYIPAAMRQNATPQIYVYLLLIGVVQQIAIGLYTVCEYKMPYYIYHAGDYGRILSICGIISALLSLGYGALVSTLTGRYSYPEIMKAAFLVSALLMGVVFVLTFYQKSLIAQPSPPVSREKEKLSLVQIFRHPVFSRLIFANVARGFASGVIGVLAAVALNLGYDEAFTSFMVSVQSAATLAACAFFAVSTRKLAPEFAVLIGSVLLLTAPALMIDHGGVFLLVYAILLCGRTLIDYAVPSMLLRIVPVEIAGPYHAWRMVLQNGGALIATTAAAWLPIWLLLLLTALLQIVSGISFFRIARQYTKK